MKIFNLNTLIILLVLLIASCGAPMSEQAAKEHAWRDSIAVEQVDSTNIDTGGTLGSVDSIEAECNPPMRLASLCYSYFTRMFSHETKDINVSLSITNPKDGMIKTLKQAIADQAGKPIEQVENDSVFCIDVSVYKYITLTLIDLDSAFNSRDLRPSRQEIDNTEDCYWRWTIKPKNDLSNLEPRLIIRTEAETPDGIKTKLSERDIHIKVTIDPRNWFLRLISYLANHPAYFLSAILIPSFAFFGKKFVDKRSRK